MSSPTNITQCKSWVPGGLYIMAHIKGPDGLDILQAAIASIDVTVYDVTAVPDAITYSSAPVVATVVFNTLQTSSLDPRWTADNRGYNFGFQLPGAAFPTKRRSYRIVVTFTPVIGDVFLWVLEDEGLDPLD